MIPGLLYLIIYCNLYYRDFLSFALLMSLLREAEKCLANQKFHSALNAFITPLQESAQWRDRVKDADMRREQGTAIDQSTYLQLTDSFQRSPNPISTGD